MRETEQKMPAAAPTVGWMLKTPPVNATLTFLSLLLTLAFQLIFNTMANFALKRFWSAAAQRRTIFLHSLSKRQLFLVQLKVAWRDLIKILQICSNILLHRIHQKGIPSLPKMEVVRSMCEEGMKGGMDITLLTISGSGRSPRWVSSYPGASTRNY